MVGITAAFEIWRGTLKSKMGNLDKPPLFDSNKIKRSYLLTVTLLAPRVRNDKLLDYLQISGFYGLDFLAFNVINFQCIVSMKIKGILLGKDKSNLE